MKKTTSQKRAGIIKGLYSEMEQQDMVIEIFRELIIEKEKLPEETLNIILKEKLDAGPKRIRPQTREELRMILRELDGYHDQMRTRYYELNPAKDPDKYKEKEIQTEPFNFDLSKPILKLDDSLFIDLKDSVKLEGIDKENEEKIKDLQANITIQKNTKDRLEDTIKKQALAGNSIANLAGDLEDLQFHLVKEKEKIENQKNLNEEVEKKLEILNENKKKTVNLFIKNRIRNLTNRNKRLRKNLMKF